MKSLCLLLSVVVGFAFTTAARAEDSTRASKLPSKLPKKSAKKQVTKINFEQNSGTHVTTVVVRTPLPLEQALEDQTRAANDVHDLRKPLEISPEPQVRYHLNSKLSAKQTQKKSLLLEPQKPLAQAGAPSEVPSTAPSGVPAAVPAPELVVAATTETPAHETFVGPPVPVTVQVSAPAPQTPTPQVPTPLAATPPADTASIKAARTSSPTPRGSSEDYFLARGSFLNAQYSELASELANGAHSFGLGLARPFEWLEARLQVEAGFGMDQEMAAQNIRHLLARGDAVFFLSSGFIKPFAAFGIGFGSFYVRSQRVNSKGRDILYREHAKGTAFIATPAAGARFDFGHFVVDTTVEYLVVSGAGSSTALGGWTGALTLGLPF